MVVLDNSQYSAFINAEKECFINNIKKEILEKYHGYIKNRETLVERLTVSYNYLLKLNFSDETLIRVFLYLTAFNEEFNESSEIKTALEKKGCIPEQQFRDLLLIIKNKINRGGGLNACCFGFTCTCCCCRICGKCLRRNLDRCGHYGR